MILYNRSLTLLRVWCAISRHQFLDIHKAAERAGVHHTTAFEICGTLEDVGWVSIRREGYVTSALALMSTSADVPQGIIRNKRSVYYRDAAFTVDALLTALLTGATRASICTKCDMDWSRVVRHVKVLRDAGRIHVGKWERALGDRNWEQVLVLGPGVDAPAPRTLTSGERRRARDARIAAGGFSVFSQRL